MNTQTRRGTLSNLGLALICLAAAFALTVPATYAAPPATGDWTLVWSDEFDCGSTKIAPNSANWGYEYGYVRNSEDQKYTDSLKNAYCQNGLMNIEAHKEQDGTITSTSLVSYGKVSYKYGWIEMRGRIDTRLGSWPAFWSLGTVGDWPDSGESDIMEYYQGKLLFNAAWQKTGDGQWDARWDSVAVNLSSLPSGWKDEFHVWAMEWTPDYVKYYMDGVLYNTWDSSQDNNGGGDSSTEGFQHPHYLLLNQAIGGTAGGDASGLAYPTTYEIDYVRWYQNENPETKVDDNNADISYSSGWGTWEGNPGYLSTEHYSETAGSEATFTFTGNQARYYGFKRNDLGFADILVDGVLVTTLDLYSSSSLYNYLLYETEILPWGEHTITVRVNGSQNPSSSGYEVIIDAFSWIDNGAVTTAPAANFTSSVSHMTVDFADGSTDSNGTIASWSWDFGDSSTETSQNPSHPYTAEGTYTVTLTVTDDDGETNSTSRSVTVPEQQNSPPNPDPMTWSAQPYMNDSWPDDNVATMTASVATDADGGIEYFFDCIEAPDGGGWNGGEDSGWQTSNTFSDWYLLDGYTYTYRVKARDALGNETNWSAVAAITTGGGGGGGGTDTTAPTPNPMTWAQTPYLNPTWPSDNVATMTATTASDPSGGVEYYFECIEAALGCEDSGWQAGSTFSDWYLASGNSFNYRVKARDALGNETNWSAVAAITIGGGSGGSDADPATTVAYAPNGVVGQPIRLLVKATDANGIPLTAGGDTITANITGANSATPTFVDNNDGTYLATYIPSQTGTNSVSILLNGTELAISPLSSQVSQGFQLRVMSFNVKRSDLYEWDTWRLAETINAILEAGADIVGTQEMMSAADLQDVADGVGFGYIDYSSRIASRYPIVDTSPGYGVQIEVLPEQYVWVFNTHWGLYAPWDEYYLPYTALSSNYTEAEVIDRARHNWDERSGMTLTLSHITDDMAPAFASGDPVFLVGDFNEPSHLDWTQAAADAGVVPMKVNAPLSNEMLNLGFTDSFRAMRPDEVNDKAHTWTPETDIIHDRIDFIHFMGTGVTVTDSQVVGENSLQAEYITSPWPSDHRAVISTFVLPGDGVPYTPTQTIMSWVASYAIDESKAAVEANLGTCSAKDGLTRIGLQFWLVNSDGTLGYDPGVADTDVDWWTNWGATNGIKILLTTHNSDGGWDWPLARSAFADNRTTLVNSLVAELERLNLDGVDLDFEGIGNFESDRSAFSQFISELSVALKSRGKLLTVDSFPYTWNAPNINWYSDWVGKVDNIHSMGYDDLYEGGPDWQKYSYQQNTGASAGYSANTVLMGMPGWLDTWGTSSGRGTDALAHVQEVRYDLPNGPTGIAIWDLQLSGASWQYSDTWCEIAGLKTGGGGNIPPTASISYVCTNLDCSFTDKSSDGVGAIASWLWDFGDTTGSTNQNPSHAYAAAGTYTATLTVTDNEGATDSTSSSVTVSEPPVPDTEAPTITAPADVSVEATSVTTTVNLGSATATDNVDTNPAVTNDALAAFPVGTTTVTWTATDASGNSASATQTVTVTDTTAPTITAPADVSVESSESIAVALGAPTVSDLVDPSPTVSNNGLTSFPIGTTTVIWTATDAAGNSASATQTVNVTEPPPPVEIHVGNLSATASGNKRWTATVTITVHNSSDATVAGVTVSGTWSDGSSGSCVTDNFGQCSTVRATRELSLTFTVASLSSGEDTYDADANHDPDGDSDGTSITINRDGSTSEPGGDTTPPIITLLGNNSVTITVGSTYVDAGATANDDVDGDLTDSIQTVSKVNTDVAGTYTVTYNVSDNAGNTAEQVVRTVTVTVPGALAAPTDLSAKLSRRTETVALKWNDSNSGDVEFIIERNKDGGAYSEIATVTDITSYTDDLSGITGTFYYRVKADNGTDESNYSNVASISKK